MSARLLITGCDGFIGRHLVEGALAKGVRTTGLHRSVGAPETLTPGTCGAAERVHIDLSDQADFGALCAALQGVDAVIHAAAAVRMFGRRASIVRENVDSTARLLRAATSAGLPKIVFLSSASVLFAAREQLDMDESTPLPARCMNGYAESKRRCEDLVLGYDGESAILRPQAVIGPGDQTLLPPILRAARAGKWAWLGAPDAACTDLLSVQNLVRWSLQAAVTAGATGVFHLSDGEPRCIESVLRTVFERLGLSVGERRVPRAVAIAAASAVEWPMAILRLRAEPPVTRFGVEVLTRSRSLDIGRAQRILGPPQVCFDQGLERMLVAHVG